MSCDRLGSFPLSLQFKEALVRILWCLFSFHVVLDGNLLHSCVQVRTFTSPKEESTCLGQAVISNPGKKCKTHWLFLCYSCNRRDGKFDCFRVLLKSTNCMLCWYMPEVHATQVITTALFEVLLVTGSA